MDNTFEQMLDNVIDKYLQENCKTELYGTIYQYYNESTEREKKRLRNIYLSEV